MPAIVKGKTYVGHGCPRTVLALGATTVRWIHAGGDPRDTPQDSSTETFRSWIRTEMTKEQLQAYQAGLREHLKAAVPAYCGP